MYAGPKKEMERLERMFLEDAYSPLVTEATDSLSPAANLDTGSLPPAPTDLLSLATNQTTGSLLPATTHAKGSVPPAAAHTTDSVTKSKHPDKQ